MGCDPEPFVGDVFLDTDDELQNYPGHVSITGNLVIYQLEAAQDLGPLECLREVGGNVELRNNPALQRLDGLDELRTVGGYLYLLGNPSLQSLAGLEALEQTGDFLFVEDHQSLTSFVLPSLETIGGRLRVWNDPQVTSIELPAIAGAAVAPGSTVAAALWPDAIGAGGALA